jgi:hypothetical protein
VLFRSLGDREDAQSASAAAAAALASFSIVTRSCNSGTKASSLSAESKELERADVVLVSARLLETLGFISERAATGLETADTRVVIAAEP